MTNTTNHIDHNLIPHASNRELRYAVVGGDCVWGAGFTAEQALKSAAFWLDGGQNTVTIAEVQKQLEDSRNSHDSNGLYLIAKEDDQRAPRKTSTRLPLVNLHRSESAPSRLR